MTLMLVVNAGHNLPILLRSGGRVDRLQPTVMVLGVMADTVVESRQVEIKPTDRVLLFTDGFSEAFNKRDEEYGEERLTKSSGGCTEPQKLRTSAIKRSTATHGRSVRTWSNISQLPRGCVELSVEKRHQAVAGGVCGAHVPVKSRNQRATPEPGRAPSTHASEAPNRNTSASVSRIKPENMTQPLVSQLAQYEHDADHSDPRGVESDEWVLTPYYSDRKIARRRLRTNKTTPIEMIP
jgi:hypothetical protein